MIDKSVALGLSSRIVDDILADPAKAEQFKDTLAATFADVYNNGASTRPNFGVVKHVLMSKTFWGIAVSGAATVAGWFGHHIGNEQIVSYTATAVGLAGSALAMYGCFVAKEDLTWKTTSE